MRIRSRSIVSLFLASTLLLAFVGNVAPLRAQPAGVRTDDAAPEVQRSPLRFVQNVGQFARGAQYQVQAGGATIWLAEDALWLSVTAHDPAAPGAASPDREPAGPRTQPATGAHIRLTFPGASLHPRLEPFSSLATHVSYINGQDPAGWHADVPVWARVTYRDLYPGVDLELSGDGGRWTPRLRLQPGVSNDALSPVRLRVEGATAVAVDGAVLRLTTVAGEVAWPLFEVDGTIGAPQVSGDQVLSPFVSGAIPEARSGADAITANSSELLFSSFLGGGGDDSGWSMASDASGAIYLSGLTTSLDFPTTPGAFQTTVQAFDAFVTKINPSGTTIIYSTYLGGSDQEGARALVVDASGAAYVTGYTMSSDFPTTPGALQSLPGGMQDMFLTKLNVTGTAPIYSTILGKAGDDQGREILLGAGGLATVVGFTQSQDFPVTAGVLQPTYGGATDGFVLTMNGNGSALVASTFLGGSDYDEVRALLRDAQGTLYLTGRTRSLNFPTTPGAFQDVAGGDSDAWAARVDGTLSSVLYATLLGGTGYDFGRGLAVDGTGAAYIIGVTQSDDYPTTPGAFQPNSATHQDAFVTKLNASGTALEYSTYLGGTGGEAGRSIVLDSTGAAYVGGWTTSPNYPTTPNAFQTSRAGSAAGAGDAFVTVLDPAGSGLIYSSYFGGSGDDGIYGGLLLEATGAVVFSGYSWSPDLPITAGAFQPVFGGGNDDAFVVRLAAGRATQRFTLQPGRLNDIAVSLEMGAVITNAESLARYMEKYSGVPVGSVQSLLKWRPSTQNFTTWSHRYQTGDNFAISTGDYVLARLTADGPTGLTLVGVRPAPGSVHFALVRGTATTCARNFLSLPYDQAQITNADQLSDAIGGVVQALDWNTTTGTFRVWSNRTNSGDNFATTPGSPYVVCLDNTAPAIWP